jgi:molecular chaperone HtpG
MSEIPVASQAIPFKAETKQILNILIHSLYTEREIFLRELISNASDALTRMDFEQLTNRDILDPEKELGIWISADPEKKIITIEDTGVGMTAEEMLENLGTIAHSGARAFIAAAGSDDSTRTKLSDIIGQFGVGFYSVFMVAKSVRVISRSCQPQAQAAVWTSEGDDTFSIGAADKEKRGTTIEVTLNEDAAEFAQENRLREIIRKHSDFVPYPIYLGSNSEQVNQRTAIWRQNPRQVEKKDYEEFYKQLTLDFETQLTHTHLAADAPVQVYSILFVPSRLERGFFSLRKEDGLKLYARKVLIQEYCKELLPEYLQFLHGVVDSEDLSLNVSRESVQSNRVMEQLKKLITNKAIDMLIKLAEEEEENYLKFWGEFGRHMKQGVAMEITDTSELQSLLRFHTTTQPDSWSSLEDYIDRMKESQTEIFYILGDNDQSILYSPHLDMLKKHGYEVLLMTDPLDSFMLVRLKEYKGHSLRNVAQANLRFPEQADEATTDEKSSVPVENWAGLIDRFKTQLDEKVKDVRMTDRLADSPARLVDPEGSPNQEMQRVYKYLQQEFEVPPKILELNPRHPILVKLSLLDDKDERNALAIEQIYENALLIEGLLKDPAQMIGRIHRLIESALD